MGYFTSEHLGLQRLIRGFGVGVGTCLVFELASGCAGEPTPPAEYPAMEAPPAAAASAAATPEPAAAPPAPATPPPPPVQVVAAENTPLEGAAPTVKIKAPK